MKLVDWIRWFWGCFGYTLGNDPLLYKNIKALKFKKSYGVFVVELDLMIPSQFCEKIINRVAGV